MIKRKQEQFKVNLHILENCNYRCRHCFAHFDSKILLVSDWKKIIDNCSNAISVCEYNIAGGEPLLYKNLPELVKYINGIGADCSVITSGYFMDEKWIKENSQYFKTIGFSIDSFNEDTLIVQGRCNAKEQFLSKERFFEFCKWIKEYNPKCKIKINTVITSLNKEENIAKIIREIPVPIARWKILKMRVFKNDKFDNSDIQVSDDEYKGFLKRNIKEFVSLEKEENVSSIYIMPSGMEIVAEWSVQGAYIIIDPEGYLIDNSKNDNHIQVANCITEDFGEGLKKVSFNKELYFSRYR